MARPGNLIPLQDLWKDRPIRCWHFFYPVEHDDEGLADQLYRAGSSGDHLEDLLQQEKKFTVTPHSLLDI